MDDDALWGWIGAILVIGFIITLPWCLSNSFFSSEITVFPISYDEHKHAIAHDRVVFTVFPERQEVIATTLNDEKEMFKLQKCTVRDKQNWVCSNYYIEHKMTDGKYTETTAYSTKYTNGWYWWFVRFCNLTAAKPKK
ncbi:MAG: hypothetical protein ABSF52_11050 [Syntrophobacteraceae bacterium]